MRIFSLLFLVFSAPLFAEISADTFESLTFEDLLNIEVTGSTLTQQSLLIVPSAVSVFTHEEITRMGFEYVDELATIVPGFQSYRSGQTPLETPISSRGRQISLASAEILVMLDGQRMDGPRSNGTTIVYPKISLENIEKIEFIRGPGAAIYGSNAMMGIINIVTRSNVNEVTLNFGSFNRRRLSLKASKNLGDFSLDLFAKVDTDDGEEYRLSDTFSAGLTDTRDPRTTEDLSFKISWRDTRVNFQHHRFKSEDFYELDGISNGFNQRRGAFSALSIRQSFDWRTVESWLQLSYKESRVTISGQLTEEGALAAISTPSSNDELFVVADFDGYSEGFLQWHNTLTNENSIDFQFGMELRYVDAPQAIAKNNFDVSDLANGRFPIRYYGAFLPTTSVQGEAEREIFSFYAQAQKDVFTDTHLTIGLRYDDFGEFGSQLSPRIGLIYELSEKQSLKLLYGEAFRAPSESELRLENNPVLLGNPELDPETVKTWDLIWVGQWKNTAVSAGYYESHFTDAIAEAPSAAGFPSYENIEQGPSKGFEFELSHQLSHRWLIKSTYTHITDKPELSFREADRLASLMFNYQHRRWNANLIATWHDERELSALDTDANRIQLDSQWLLYAKVSYHFDLHWLAYFQIKNLSDEAYNSPTLGASVSEGVPNRGREMLIGVNWQY